MAAVSNHNGFFPLSALQPDQRRHSAGRAVPPEREETRRVGEGAQVAAARPADAGPGQAPARKAVEIREPATGRRRREAAGRTRSSATKTSRTSWPTSKARGPMAGPSQARRSAGAPGARATACSAPSRETAPACVGRGDPVTASVAEQDRQTSRRSRRRRRRHAGSWPRHRQRRTHPRRARHRPRRTRAPGAARTVRRAARAPRASRRRFSATCAGSSPTCSARFRLSQGLPLTPPSAS